MRLQVLMDDKLHLVEEGQSLPILNGFVTLRLSPTTQRPEIKLSHDKLPNTFVISDEDTTDQPYKPRYRNWTELKGNDTNIVIYDEGDNRFEARVAVEAELL